MRISARRDPQTAANEHHASTVRPPCGSHAGAVRRVSFRSGRRPGPARAGWICSASVCSAVPTARYPSPDGDAADGRNPRTPSTDDSGAAHRTPRNSRDIPKSLFVCAARKSETAYLPPKQRQFPQQRAARFHGGDSRLRLSVSREVITQKGPVVQRRFDQGRRLSVLDKWGVWEADRGDAVPAQFANSSVRGKPRADPFGSSGGKQ